MLKVLIVEDEDFERRALKFLVNKYFSRKAYVVGEASNGKEALDQALVLKPDAILMDINMPIMDGLEASKRIKEINKDVEIIILTAYDYFEYAKEAIKCEVSDYLVKPFSNKEFTSSLGNVVKKVNARDINTLKRNQINQNFAKAMSFVEKELVTQIAYGDQSKTDDLVENIRLLGIRSKDSCCIIIGNQNGNVFKKESIQSVKNILTYMAPQVIGSRFLGDLVFFIFDDEVENISLSKRMEDILKDIKTHFKDNENIDVVIEVGPVVGEVSEYSYSYNQARAALRSKEQSINSSHTLYNNKCLNIDDKENSISSKIINEDLDGAIKEIRNLMNIIIESTDGDDLGKVKAYIYKIVIKIKNNVLDFTDNEKSKLTEDRIYNEISSLNNYIDINNYLDIFVKESVEDISDYKNTSNMNIVINAKKFINENYMRDIRLEDVAKHVYISSYYLSRIFKKHEGINYIQYLTKVRMEKAKELIIEDKTTIKEIAAAVGFVDQNYFSRAFKKYTGESPKEFSLKHKKY